MRFKVSLDGREVEVEVVRQGDRLRVSYERQSHEARMIYRDGAHFVLEVEEQGADGFVRRRRIRAAGYRDGDKRQLWANGRLVTYRRIREGGNVPADEDAASLAASIPAVVSEVLVKSGDWVKSGDKLVLLESMKMILPVQAPRDGMVTAVHCTPGQAVQPGVQLVELGTGEQGSETGDRI
jgi:biotin carboxyl carrier protein